VSRNTFIIFPQAGLVINKGNFILLIIYVENEFKYFPHTLKSMPVESSNSYIRFRHSFETEVEKFMVLFSEPGKHNTFTSNPLKKQSFTLGDYNNWFSDSAKFTWNDYVSSSVSPP
tara:strand:- start:115 stop:462 length:348 start_codon:yes stop_codon:yes gene_type:complete